MYNPERRAWRGRSYRKGGEPIRALREQQSFEHEAREAKTEAQMAVGDALDELAVDADYNGFQGVDPDDNDDFPF